MTRVTTSEQRGNGEPKEKKKEKEKKGDVKSIYYYFNEHTIFLYVIYPTQTHDRWYFYHILSKNRNILPEKILCTDESEIDNINNAMISQWPDISDAPFSVLESEALLWKQKWEDSDDLPTTFIDYLNECNQTFFRICLICCKCVAHYWLLFLLQKEVFLH